MLLKINGIPLADQVIEPIINLPANTLVTQSHGFLLGTVAQIKELNLDQLESHLMHMGQDILITTAVVFTVVCGILIIVGLKREGWKRFAGILQGLGLGLVGPVIVTGVAAFCIGIAKTLI